MARALADLVHLAAAIMVVKTIPVPALKVRVAVVAVARITARLKVPADLLQAVAAAAQVALAQLAVAQAAAKVMAEVAQAPVEQQSEEIGDLLFAVANWSRHLSVDPEEALRLANAKFERRFRAMEQLARERSLTLKTLDAAAWDALWNEVKKREKSSETNVQ